MATKKVKKVTTSGKFKRGRSTLKRVKATRKIRASKAVKAKKVTRKAVAAAQKTARRVAKGKKPRAKAKGEPKFKVKPAIPIEEIGNRMARVQIPALILEIRDYDEQTAEVMEELGPSLEAISEMRAEAVAKLTGISAAAKIEVVEGDDWRLSYVAGERKSLSQIKLLELGVSAATIKKATVVTKVKPFVRISAKGETDSDTEG